MEFLIVIKEIEQRPDIISQDEADYYCFNEDPHFYPDCSHCRCREPSMSFGKTQSTVSLFLCDKVDQLQVLLDQ
jgi:hypothetical protein